MKNIALIIIVVLLAGCSSVNGTAKISETAKGVKFEASRPVKMTMERDGKTYTYDSQSPSLLSKLLGALTLGAMGAK